MIIKKLTTILILFLIHFCFGQNFESRLQKAYDNFDNHEVDSLLTLANQEYSSLSQPDQIAYHKFKAFRAFQLGEQQILHNHFRELIVIDPLYTLDPLTTSPKLLTLFDKAKIEYLESQQQRLKELTGEDSFPETPWRSLLFPGWEQWHRGSKGKGTAWMAFGTVTLTGTLQSVIRTSSKHQQYLDEKDPQRAAKKYQSYNDVYRSQYYWAYSLLVVWIASHVDAVFFTENKSLEIACSIPEAEIISIGLNIHL